MWKVNISKWIDKELHSTELALLKAEDDLQNAQLRVNALAARCERLKGKRLEGKQAERAGPDYRFAGDNLAMQDTSLDHVRRILSGMAKVPS